MNHKAFTLIGCVLAIVLFIISCASTTAEPQQVARTGHKSTSTWYEIRESSLKQDNTYSLCYLANSPAKCYRCSGTAPALAANTGLPMKVTLFKPFSIGLKAIVISRG